LGIFEINDAAKLVQEAVHPEANIIFGAVIDDTLGDEVRVTVIAAGFDGGEPLVKKSERRATYVTAGATADVAAVGTAGAVTGGSVGAPLASASPASVDSPVEAPERAWGSEPEVPVAPVDPAFHDSDDDLDIP